jgi:hypothetical protein
MNGFALPFRDRLGINVAIRSVPMQQICETMLADEQSTPPMPNLADIADTSARAGKPVAIKAVAR